MYVLYKKHKKFMNCEITINREKKSNKSGIKYYSIYINKMMN